MSQASAPKAHPAPLYNRDLYAWSQEQARLLRAGRLAELDTENLAEEILDVGRNEYDKLESALRILLTHMLKWDHQPEGRSASWEATIDVQRRHTLRQLSDNPSLKSRRDAAVREAYKDARQLARGETGLSLRTFPETCPYDWAAITERAFVRD